MKLIESKPGKGYRLGILIAILLYVAMNGVLSFLNQIQNFRYMMFGVYFEKSSFTGVFAQVQVMIAVWLVVKYNKTGLIIDYILCAFNITLSVLPIFTMKTSTSLPGIIVTMGTILIVTIIYGFGNSLKEQLQKVNTQTKELTGLYEVVAKSEEMLSNQNAQLEEYNKRLENRGKELKKLVYYDSLTGLPNRRMITKRLDYLTKRANSGFAVVFVDIDNFKKINDSAGHYKGDRVLIMVVQRWKKLIHNVDLLGRIGGDEFALIIQQELSKEEIHQYVETLREALLEKIIFGNREFYISASFGISLYPVDGKDSEQLLKNADTAMYEAKSSGKNAIEFFNRPMQEKIVRKVTLENRLQDVLKRNELYLVFQPQYDCRKEKLRGFETLLRWNSEELGGVSPSEFIPIAEESGFIAEIGEWVLENACKKFKAIMETYNCPLILSVNISVVQLIDANFVTMVEKVLKRTEFNPTYLEFEVTESVFISSMEYVVDVLNRLKEMGIEIALDDFGTGYASLSYLQMLPIDIIKIDKSFMDHLLTGKSEKELIGSIIYIAHQLGDLVIAEGVEEEEQVKLLTEKGCDFIQGYIYGKPLEEEQVYHLIEQMEYEPTAVGFHSFPLEF